MMTISSTGIGQLDMASMSKVNPKSKEQAEGIDAFASLMNMGSTNTSNDVDINDLEDNIKPIDNSEAIDKETEYASDDVYKKTVEPEKADGPEKVSDIPENNKYNTENKDVTDDEAIVQITSKLEELTVKFEGLLDELKTMLKDLLGEIKNTDEMNTDDETVVISDEQLQNVLSSMGINLQDLLNVSDLKDFILELNGSTEVNILIDENLANMINKFTAKLEEILQENGITDVESFINELEAVTKDVEVLTQQNAPRADSLQTDAPTDEVIMPKNVIKGELETKAPEIDKSEPEVVIKNNKIVDKKIEVNVAEDSYQGTANQESFAETRNQIVLNLNQAIDNVVNTNNINDVSAFVDGLQEADVVRQIIDNIKLNISKDTTSIVMQLNPEHLGKVQITVASKDGVMQAQIIAETEAAKNAIEGSIAALKEAFQNQELKVEAVEVMVASYEFFNQGNAGDNQDNNAPSKRTGAINMADIPEEEMTDEELIEAEIMKAKGNSVSYSV